MKNKTFISFMAFLLLASVSFIGCDGDGGGVSSQDTQALTENDFAKDPAIFANPRGGVVVTFLEHPNSEKPENDTGVIGVDIIQYRYNEDLNHTFCFEDENADAEYFAILFDSEGNEVLRIQANGECVTELILAGDYLLEITHDGKIEEVLAIFAIPQQSGEQAAQRFDTDQGLLKSAKIQLSNIINDLYNIITQTSNAQSNDNVGILLNTRSCVMCDLSGVNLVNADLTGVDLFQADLFQANLSGADLRPDQNGKPTNLTFATLCEATLSSAKLQSSMMCGADLLDDDCKKFVDNQNQPLGPARIDGAVFDGAISVTDGCSQEPPCSSGLLPILPVAGGQGTALTCELPTNSDRFDTNLFTTFPVCNTGSTGQCILITEDTIMMIQAWGGAGGSIDNCNNISPCSAEDDESGQIQAGGYAQTITTLRDLAPAGGGSPILFVHLGKNGTNGGGPRPKPGTGANGGSSTIVSANIDITVNPSLVLLIAGGGGGAGSCNRVFDGFSCCGGNGGTAIATTSANGLGDGQDGGVEGEGGLGFGSKCPDKSGKGAPAGGGGAGAEGATNGLGGFGGAGGPGSTIDGPVSPTGWINSSLTSDSILDFGLGGTGQPPAINIFTGGPKGDGGGGGGGGFGGGGGGSNTPGPAGAGGGAGSFGLISTKQCASAPTSRPVNPIFDSDIFSGGNVRIVFFNDSDC